MCGILFSTSVYSGEKEKSGPQNLQKSVAPGSQSTSGPDLHPATYPLFLAAGILVPGAQIRLDAQSDFIPYFMTAAVVLPTALAIFQYFDYKYSWGNFPYSQKKQTPSLSGAGLPQENPSCKTSLEKASHEYDPGI